jgi:catechol 2,3-dioxygenase-like lactoylglutathione lyase family enzyme
MANEVFKGYAHIGIYVVNREKAIDFYKTVFGFELLYRADPPDGHKIGMLKLNNCIIEVLQHPDAAVSSNVIPSATSTLNHIGISVTDRDKAVAQVRACGYKIDDGDIYDVDNFGSKDLDLKVAFFRGPNGERFEIFEEIYKK